MSPLTVREGWTMRKGGRRVRDGSAERLAVIDGTGNRHPSRGIFP
jgi:hypothetical protein